MTASSSYFLPASKESSKGKANEETYPAVLGHCGSRFGKTISQISLRGMGKVDGHFIIILNVDYVLSLDEMSSLAGVGMGTAVAS